MNLVDGTIPVFGEADEATLNQIRTCAKTAYKVALMPDNHKGYGVPIGGVVAYKDAISPSGVGYDIACGNKAVRLDMTGDQLRANIKPFMDEIFKTISFGIGCKNGEQVDSEVLDTVQGAWKLEATRSLRDKAAAQLGTVGSGNHYVDLFTDEQDRAWIGAHFGSRGFGHGIATWFLKAGGAADGMDVEPLVLPVNSDLGAQYLLAMKLAGRYAYAGRSWVCDRVARILGAEIVEEVHNHHNYAWKEAHNGEDLWVVRKGATPAFPGIKGFVGGSMGEQSVILEGVENADAKYSLYSTVHGAGRAMGRTEAKGTVDRKTGVVKRPGRVTKAMMQGWVDRAGIELRGAGLDESPDCYKRLDKVLEACGDSIKILHRLTPVGVAMAGPEVKDPYKD